MVLVYLALGLVSLLLLAYSYLIRHFNYWKVRNVAGPEPATFYGNMKEFVLRKKNIGIVIQDFYKQYPNEKVVGLYKMSTPFILIRDLDVIKHIMIKDFNMFMDRGMEFSNKELGANLFHADGDTWEALRNRFTPIFTSGKLKNMIYLMTERADKLKDYVDSVCDEYPEQNAYGLIQKYTLATISACAFGVDIDSLNDKLDVFYKIDKMILTPNYAVEFDMIFPGMLKKLNLSIFPPLVKNFFYGLVRSVVSQRGGLPSDRKDFMDLILELKQEQIITSTKRYGDNQKLTLELTEDVIAAQAFIFYVGGYETTATTVSYLLYQLALNPHIQDKLLAEIDQTLAERKGVVDYDTIQSMKYMEKVFSETLRIYPVVEPLQRCAKANYQIPGTDVVIEKGMSVFISALGVHHDETYYPNPHIFDPERFSSEQSGKRHPCAYIPFGTGPRNCIGMRFAKLQGPVCLVKLLSKFRVEPSKNTPKVMEFEAARFVVGPKEGQIYLNFVRRKPMNA